MPAGVLLRGSGATVTTADPDDAGVVDLGDGSALSDIRVVHDGAGAAVSVSATSRAAQVRDAELVASDAAILITAGGTAKVLMTQLVGGPADGDGTYRCMGAYNGDFMPLDRACG